MNKPVINKMKAGAEMDLLTILLFRARYIKLAED
jgi:hypothetical protein